jgi:CxxC-x17-CxxC domain-containing protein
MGNFQGGGNRGGGFRGGNGGGRSSFRGGGRDDREVTMHKAVCSKCHKDCEVPFRPSSDKPVYCNDCFSSKREDGDRGPRRDFGNRGPKREFNDRPASHSAFSRPTPASDGVGKQLGEMNAKLDRLINSIDKLVQPKAEVEKTPSLKTVIKKVVAKKTPSAKKVIKKKK